MSVSFTSSPAEIVRAHIVLQGSPIFTRPSLGLAWPLFVGHMPEDDKSGLPIEVGAIYDTIGVPDGRLMETGEHIFHEGFQVKVRSRNYTAAHSRLKALTNFLQTIKNEAVITTEGSFTILNISQSTSIVSLGQGDVRRRTELTANFLITLQ